MGELYDGLVKSLRRDLRDEVKAEVKAEVDSDYARSIAELYFPDIKSGEVTIEKALTYVPPPLKDEFKRNIDRMLASSE
ncbi:MAG: hypothetical protein E7Z63_03150 [Thermoplasmata archaeon]|nr:hypothetical protein [Thermoplasmata archaeon]